MVWQKMLASVAGSAIGKVVGKVVDYIPGKSESRRNKIDRLEKQQDELKAKKHRTNNDILKLNIIARKLAELYKQAKNE
jgi:hypothetical protein